jgi:hypothetical protein
MPASGAYRALTPCRNALAKLAVNAWSRAQHYSRNSRMALTGQEEEEQISEGVWRHEAAGRNMSLTKEQGREQGGANQHHLGLVKASTTRITTASENRKAPPNFHFADHPDFFVLRG